MSSSVSVANVFIDLATFSELEGFLYGGYDAATLFVLAVQKANWFSYIPIALRATTGNADFGMSQVSYSVNRSGDYVINTWFRAQIPQIWLNQDGTLYTNASVAWTRNLMHNLIANVQLNFNELTVHEFTNFWLDINFQFRKSGAKRIGYRNMIGDVPSMTSPVGPGVPLGRGEFFSVPLPFFFSEDTGLALPVAALPFNDIQIVYTLRRWEDLVTIYPGTAAVGGPGGPGTGHAATTSDVFVYGSTTQKPSLLNPSTNAHYAVVHNDERIKMGDAPRDMLIHQVQQAQTAAFKDLSSTNMFDIRMSHSIVVLAFAALNNSINALSANFGGEWSNYTTEYGYTGADPLANTALIYDSTTRLDQGSDYYSLIHPNFFHEAIPDETGYHVWSYGLYPWAAAEPSGSTNYSKLANVSIIHTPSPAAVAAAGIGTASGRPEDRNGVPIVYPNASGVEVDFAQSFLHILCARNMNVARFANGSIGLPVL